MPIAICDPDSIRQAYVDATDGQTVMPLPAAGLRTECIEIWLNGIQQDPSVGWTRSGNNVVFAEPLVAADIVRIVWSDP